MSSATSRRGNAPDQLRMDAQRVRTFFQEVDEGKQAGVASLADLMGGAVGKQDGRIRGVMSDGFHPNELRLLDEQTKKEIRRYLPHPKLEPNFLNWHVFRKQWRFYLAFWGSVMSPHLRTLTLLACLPDKEADSYLKCIYELGWGCQDISSELKTEAKALSDPVVVQQEWQNSRPSSAALQDYRAWILHWSVLLKRLGRVSQDIAKIQYLHALLFCGFYDSQLEKLYEHADQQPKNLTLEQCHNFLMPLLCTHRCFNVSKQAAGRGVDDNAPEAKPDLSADVLPVRALNGDRSNRAEQRGRSPERGQGWR